jgi:Glycosyl hydrolase family 26
MTRRQHREPARPRSHARPPRPRRLLGSRRLRTSRMAAVLAVVLAVAAAAVIITLDGGFGGAPSPPARAYVGVFAPPAPASYAGVRAFTAATGVRPGLVAYYSAWNEPFRSGFARTAARHHAVPIVQIDPEGISLAAIAHGRYDAYLRSYARSVRATGQRVVLSLGHEMNGTWYSWAYHHVPPQVFVAAWRHMVTVFRSAGAGNVTWLWTVNVIQKTIGVPSPARWWPGRAYVNWVGIDGYYLRSSWKFAALFGPTIKAVRALTLDPILISETAATQAAGQAAKIKNLFAGVRAYGLLGLVWFDANKHRDWRVAGPASVAAFRRGAQTVAQVRP